MAFSTDSNYNNKLQRLKEVCRLLKQLIKSSPKSAYDVYNSIEYRRLKQEFDMLVKQCSARPKN
jgi:hypothetical protein